MGACVKLLIFLEVVCAAYSAKSPLDCDFESSCHFIQDKTDAHDWQLNTGNTATAHTGPSRDHTLNTTAGHYIYFESSGVDNHHQSDARLLSPIFTAQRGQCLSFFYHMYGSGTGALNIYLNHINPVNDQILFSSQVWSRIGQQSQNGTDWQHALVAIDSGHGSKVDIVFEAIKGSSYLSDIAIDDILLVDSCKANNDPSTVHPPTTTPGPSTSNIPSLTFTSDVHIQANPSTMHAQFTKNLMVNCSYVHGNGSDFSTLVSMILSKKNASDDTVYTEVASITAFSNNQLEVKNDIGAHVTGHLVATGESFITLEWLYPSDQAMGDYKCEGFGLDHSGHPRVSAETTKITQLSLNCETLLPKYKETDLKLDAVKANLNNLLGTLIEHAVTHRNHSYLLSRPVAADILMGERLCDVSGGYLVEVNDRTEFEFLVNFTQDRLLKNHTSAIALGSTNEGHPKQWTFLSSADVMTYFDWLDGPSANANANCLFLGPNKKMYSDVCNKQSMVRLVCEIPE